MANLPVVDLDTYASLIGTLQLRVARRRRRGPVEVQQVEAAPTTNGSPGLPEKVVVRKEGIPLNSVEVGVVVDLVKIDKELINNRLRKTLCYGLLFSMFLNILVSSTALLLSAITSGHLSDGVLVSLIASCAAQPGLVGVIVKHLFPPPQNSDEPE